MAQRLRDASPGSSRRSLPERLPGRPARACCHGDGRAPGSRWARAAPGGILGNSSRAGGLGRGSPERAGSAAPRSPSCASTPPTRSGVAGWGRRPSGRGAGAECVSAWAAARTVGPPERGVRGPAMPGRGAGWPGRPGRGEGGRGTRGRARASWRETRGGRAEKPPRGRRPWRRAPPGAVDAREASGLPGGAGAVWVNGAAGRPHVVGPAGSVWVTGPGAEAEARARAGGDGKDPAGAVGPESILELWLKVQALRAASGPPPGSRVELHPVPTGEGPVERGVPGRASWVETNRGGVTGPWVKGPARGLPRGAGALRALCARVSGLCGLQPAAWVPPVRVPGTLESRAETAPLPPARGQAAGAPRMVDQLGYGVAPATRGVPGTPGWPEAAEVPRTGEGVLDSGGTASLWERGQVGQVMAQAAECADTPGVWGRRQAAGLPEAVQDGVVPVGAPGMWLRRQPEEERGIEGIPGLWGTGQPLGEPREEAARYGGDPGFRDRDQVLWVDTGSGGNPGSWDAAQAEEQERPGGAPDLWGVEQTMRAPQALGKEVGCGSVPGVWGTEQPVSIPQAVVAPGVIGQQPSCDAIPGLWARQPGLGIPVAEVMPESIQEKPCCGNVLSSWEQRQALEEQEVLVPPTLGASGPVDQETGCRDASCLCRRSQAVGLNENLSVTGAADVPMQRCAPSGAPIAVDLPGPGRVPERVPAAIWVSGPMCQGSNSGDVSNAWERVHAARMPVEAGAAVCPEELWCGGEDTTAGVYPGSWGRRQGLGVPVISVASEVPGLRTEQTGFGGTPGSWVRRQSASVPATTGVPKAPRRTEPLEEETGTGTFLGMPRRRQTAGVPVIAGVSTADAVLVTPRVPRSMPETGSGGVSNLWGEREIVVGSADTRCPTRMGMPLTVGVRVPMGENGPGSVSNVLGSRQTIGVPKAVRLHTGRGLPGLVGEEVFSGNLLDNAGRRQTIEMPMTAGVAMDVGVSTEAGMMEGGPSSGDDLDVWGRRLVTEAAAANVPGPVVEESGSGGISGAWRRRPNESVPEGPVKAPLTLGVLAAVGVPIAGRMPAAVWVTGPAENGVAESGLTTVRTQSTGRVSGEESGDGSVLGLFRRHEVVGVPYTHGHGTRIWSCPRSQGEDRAYENVPRIVESTITMEVPETLTTHSDSRGETGISHFREQDRRTQARVSGFRVRGSNLGANCGGEDRLRELFQK
ncbi:collagen alpha-1(III) chain [Suncus etruscus]|uniref:collagen alpha-1(III) chain n=1 Tax=Suncus etruscus TaxID=109475 RepID=UPI002110AC48|nr:collagen alpha-1(III) chain [Suncus etruscus]